MSDTTIDYRKPAPDGENPFPPGSWLGPYEIQREIGRGGMGLVLEATDSRLHRAVAIKLLPMSLRDDPTMRARFENEARLLASLNHPNIATIHSLEYLQGAHFLTMELIPGNTLRELIPGKAGDLDWVLPTIRHVANALEAAHRQGVVHCDLKPANIQVAPDGTVKVLDFGVARALGEAQETLQAGTPGYMSPEQIEERPVDRRADLFSFGAILFEMLCGQPAFPGQTVTERMTTTLRREPDWHALPDSVPDSLRALVERCLVKPVEERLADTREIFPELDRLADMTPDTGREFDQAATEAVSRTLRAGDAAPHFALRDPQDITVDSRELLARGPLVVHFYRGRW